MEHGGWLFLASGLIRAELHRDPDALTDAEWAAQVKVAESLQNLRVAKLWKPFSDR